MGKTTTFEEGSLLVYPPLFSQDHRRLKLAPGLKSLSDQSFFDANYTESGRFKRGAVESRVIDDNIPTRTNSAAVLLLSPDTRSTLVGMEL